MTGTPPPDSDLVAAEQEARSRIEHMAFCLATAADVVDPRTLHAAYDTYRTAVRNAVLTEAAELIREHRGELDDDGPWWDTRDRDTATAVLLAARTPTS